MRFLLKVFSYLIVLVIGFIGGVYALPILTAPPSPTEQQVSALFGVSKYSAEFRRELPGSDFLHWGDGKVTLSAQSIAFMGLLAPGPDYKLYLVPEYVDTADAFMRRKSQSVQVGEIKTFNNFIVPLDPAIDLEQFTTLVVWCETFEKFISAAQYR